MATSAPIAVVVVRYRGGDEVVRCLQSVRAHGSGLVAETVLVDSGSGDDGARALARRFTSLEIMELADNRSFAHAANRGAAATSAPFILFLNPDAELRPQSLPGLVKHLLGHPRAAGAVPLLENLDGSSQHAWQLRQLPSPRHLAAGRPGPPCFAAAPATPQPVAQAAAAAWLLRRPVWQALTGFDPAYAPAWWEDVDFCRRLRDRSSDPSQAADAGLWVVPAARIAHQGGSSLSTLDDASFLTIFNRNLLRYAARHHPRQLWWIRRGLRSSLLLRAVRQPRRAAAYRRAMAEIFA